MRYLTDISNCEISLNINSVKKYNEFYQMGYPGRGGLSSSKMIQPFKLH